MNIMPGGDRTGPRGFGPMTGRRAGYCAGQDMPGYESPVPGYGSRFGGRFGSRGRGHGWRHRYYASGLPGWAHTGYLAPSQDGELAGLKLEGERLKSQIEMINRRIEELERKE